MTTDKDTNEITPTYVRGALHGITVGEWESPIKEHGVVYSREERSYRIGTMIRNADAQFVASAPAIARAYLDKCDENQRLLGIIAKQSTRQYLDYHQSKDNTAFTPDEMKYLQESIKRAEEENVRLRDELEKAEARYNAELDAISRADAENMLELTKENQRLQSIIDSFTETVDSVGQTSVAVLDRLKRYEGIIEKQRSDLDYVVGETDDELIRTVAKEALVLTEEKGE